jgi:hypothetical protein
MFPNPLLFIKCISTRDTSGHGLGTFRGAKLRSPLKCNVVTTSLPPKIVCPLSVRAAGGVSRNSVYRLTPVNAQLARIWAADEVNCPMESCV